MRSASPAMGHVSRGAAAVQVRAVQASSRENYMIPGKQILDDATQVCSKIALAARPLLAVSRSLAPPKERHKTFSTLPAAADHARGRAYSCISNSEAKPDSRGWMGRRGTWRLT